MTGKDVTVTISTKNRYFSTLSICLVAIANQTVSPKKIILFDDGEHKDLREDNLYKNIFTLFDAKHIEWVVLFGTGEGQVKNHQAALSVVETELIWRLDYMGWHQLITDGDYPINSYICSYIAKPNDISISLNTTSQLNVITHNKIVDIAIGLAAPKLPREQKSNTKDI